MTDASNGRVTGRGFKEIFDLSRNQGAAQGEFLPVCFMFETGPS